MNRPGLEKPTDFNNLSAEGFRSKTRWNQWIPDMKSHGFQWLIHGSWQKSWFIIGKTHGLSWNPMAFYKRMNVICACWWTWEQEDFCWSWGKKPEALSCVPWSHGSWSSLFHVNIWQCGGSILTSLYLLFLQSQVIRFLWSWGQKNPVTSGNLLHSYWKW